MLWCLLNVEKDDYERMELISNALESLHPWMNMDMYKKVRDEKELLKNKGNTEYEGYAEELRKQGISEAEIKKIYDLEHKNG